MDWAEADRRHLWHPFTAMEPWCSPDHDPLVLVGGKGAILRDSRGREYIDGNSSIWTNIHGHGHPKIDAALRAQLDRVAHTSFLGFTNPPAIELAAELLRLAAPGALTRVFYSDDGSTAIEAALKMALQYFQLIGQPERTRFVAFENGYHGDTMGAASLGGIGLFNGRFAHHHFPVEHVDSAEGLEALSAPDGVAAVVLEPLIQGAAGMRLWPAGLLAAVRRWCDAHGALLILDEVMTGFGRTGTMFAFQQEKAVPDFLALAKGLTGGYLPLAATLVQEKIFDAFRGGTFYYGHSYCGNQLGCAAALASLRIFAEEQVLERLAPKIEAMRHLLARIGLHPRVKGTRQCGFIAGIEVHGDGSAGAEICMAARAFGLLTRPVRDTIVLMPPLCISLEELERAARAIDRALDFIPA